MILKRQGTMEITDYPGGPIDLSYEFLPFDILLVRNAIPFSEEMIAAADQAQAWGSSPIVSGDSEYQNDDIRNSDRVVCHPGSVLDQFIARLDAVVNPAVKLYCIDNPMVQAKSWELYQLLRYTPGQHFKPHMDVIPNKLNPRQLSVVCFLNKEYEGGELYFPRQNAFLVGETGMIAIFPSNFTHVHESIDVKVGVKYVVVTWFS